MPRSLLSITDLTPTEILSLFRKARDAAGDPLELGDALNGKLVAGLFWQAAPRVEAALRTACARAGASYVNGRELWPGFPEADLLGAAEAAGAYADLLVMRHPVEGAARAAAEASGIPVVNAGDGAREDPLRALHVMRRMVGSGERAPRAAAVCGDLRRNRLGHSLVTGLSSLGTTVLLVPARGGEMPEHRIARLGRHTGHQPVRFAAQSLRSILDMVDTVVLSPEIPYQHPLFGDMPVPGDDERARARSAVQELDALFVAAPHTDEGAPSSEDRGGSEHPWLHPEGRLEFRPFGGRQPLELPGRLRAEAAREVPLLASLLVFLLHARPLHEEDPEAITGSGEGMRCPHLRCIVHREHRVNPSFLVTRRNPLVLECRSCGTPVRPRFAGSRKERHYHAVEAQDLRKVLPANLVYFGSAEEAEEGGWTRAHARRTVTGPAAATVGEVTDTAQPSPQPQPEAEEEE